MRKMMYVAKSVDLKQYHDRLTASGEQVQYRKKARLWDK